ncbi:hypothetical protein [Thermus oshimai]|uniref:hypothetical protein n=1 Tax=Thermus oshimai TaxID=56957 RepID=UPI000375AA56|nr:hypothetical protein [Thermus oshimai]
MPFWGRARGLLLGLYLFLALLASTGVALQLYLMQVQNPALRGDLCTAERPVHLEHSPLCGLQVAEGLPPVEPPQAPAPLFVGLGRAQGLPGFPEAFPEATRPRGPPSL